MSELKDRVTIGLRVASMLVDHFAMTFIFFLILLPGLLFIIIDTINIDHDPNSYRFGGMLFLFSLGFSAYLNKDIFDGRSPAKRILKLQVIDNQTGKVADPLKCLLRNLIIPIWIIEGLFILINSKRRLGDKIAGTRVDYIENSESSKMDWSKFMITVLLSFGFSAIISASFISLTSGWDNEKIAYIENSFDSTLSNKTNELFQSELNGLVKEADFRVYRKIENDNRRYVAGILYLTNKSDFDNFDETEKVISYLLISEFPLDSNVCFLKFVYKEAGSISTRQAFYDSQRKEK